MSGVVLVLNGPNLNLLGQRDPAQYGTATLADIEASVRERARAAGLDVDFRQSNHEGALVDWIQQARENTAGVVINPGAYGHTSIAIRDALEMLTCPIVEVHLSNVHAREDFRHHSHLSSVATGVIVGLGAQGYVLAIDAIAQRVTNGG